MRRGLGRLTAYLRLDGTQFNASLQRQRSRLAGLARFATRVIAPLAAAAAALGSVQAIRNTLGLVDAQAKLARTLGTTSESLDVLRRAADLAGVDQSRLESSSRDLFRRLSQAAASGGPAAAALDRLGLSARGLLEMPLDERILAINTALGEHVPAAERAAVAGALFGEEGALAMTRLDAETIAQATAEIEQYGRVVSDVEAGQIEQANDAISLMMLSLRSFTTDATVALAPVLDAMARGFADLAVGARPVVQFLRDMTSLIVSALRLLFQTSDGLSGIATAYRNYLGWLGQGWAAIFRIVRGLAALTEQSGGFGAVWEHVKDIASEAMQRIGALARVMGLRLVATFQSIRAGAMARFGDILGSAGQWAARMVDIALGTKDAMLAAFGALPGALGSLMFQAANAAIGGVESLINGVITRVNRFLERINSAIARLPSWARGDFEGIAPLDEVRLGDVDNPFAGRPGVGQAMLDAFGAAQGQTSFGSLGEGLRNRGAALSGQADQSRLAANALAEANSGPLAAIEALTDAMAEARAAAQEAETATEGLAGELGDVEETATAAADALAGGGGSGGGPSITDAADDAGDAVDSLRERVGRLARGLVQALMQGERFGDVVTGAILRVAEAWATQGMESILMGLTGLSGGGRGNFFGRILGAILPGRALGGPVQSGQIYQVNENTPRSEWMFASANGGVLNHGQMNSAVRAAMGGGAAAGNGGRETVIRLDLSADLEARILGEALGQSVQVVRSETPKMIQGAFRTAREKRAFT